jgi:hypothetical protein
MQAYFPTLDRFWIDFAAPNFVNNTACTLVLCYVQVSRNNNITERQLTDCTIKVGIEFISRTANYGN